MRVWIAPLGVALVGMSYAQTVRVFDPLGRDLQKHGIQLLDWDGHLMNPAPVFQLNVRQPVSIGAPNPAPYTIQLSSNHPRVYFDTPSTVGASGPTKQVTVSRNGGSVPFRMAVFPDRAGGDETATLTIRVTDRLNRQFTRTLPIKVRDLDLPRPANNLVQVNYSWERLGWMNPARQAVIDQAAADWAYFFVNPGYATVPANNEWTFIWNTNGFSGGNWRLNPSAYNGFLLYVYSIDGPELRSGGAGSSGGGFQSVGGTPTQLRRSGTVEVERKGNYNTLGWIENTNDDAWHVSRNFGNEQNDLYSIVRHEMGHALGFNIAYPNFLAAKNGAGITDPDVVDILGGPMVIDTFDHFHGTTEPCSGCGAFGYEYFGAIPRRRWLPTKLDVLAMREVGWTLRDISALWPLSWVTTNLPSGNRMASYSFTLTGRGGSGAHDFVVSGGTMPTGLELDRFTGEIFGQPKVPGTYSFTVALREAIANGKRTDRTFSIQVNP